MGAVDSGRALLLLQVWEEGERRSEGLPHWAGRRNRRRRPPGKEEKEGESLEGATAAAAALSRYHHRLQGTKPLSGGKGPTIVEALVELASRDRSGATAHMLESMAVSVRALHQMRDDEGLLEN